MSVKLLTEQHLEFLSLKGGCRGSSESTLVKMPHCFLYSGSKHMNPDQTVSIVFAIYIGIAPIMQYMHVRNKKSNTQGSSPNVVKVIFLLLKEGLGRKFFPLRGVLILKRDVIVENHCLMQ